MILAGGDDAEGLERNDAIDFLLHGGFPPEGGGVVRTRFGRANVLGGDGPGVHTHDRGRAERREND